MDQGTSTQDRRDGEIDIGPWEHAWAERRGICETGRAIHRFRGTRKDRENRKATRNEVVGQSDSDSRFLFPAGQNGVEEGDGERDRQARDAGG